MKILAHLPACFRYRRFARSLRQPPAHDVAEIWQEISAVWDEIGALGKGQDTLDLGVIDADLNGSRANARVDEVFDTMRKLADEVRDQRCGDPDPSYEISDGEARDTAIMPAEHPESLVLELAAADEKMLAQICTVLWPADEYLDIVAEDFRQRNGGTP
jgi:hypothetical protein